MFCIDDTAAKAAGGMDENSSIDTNPMAPTLEDQLDEIRALLERMLALAEISAGTGMPEPDRQALQQELDRLRCQIDRIADGMDFLRDMGSFPY